MHRPLLAPGAACCLAARVPRPTWCRPCAHGIRTAASPLQMHCVTHSCRCALGACGAWEPVRCAGSGLQQTPLRPPFGGRTATHPTSGLRRHPSHHPHPNPPPPQGGTLHNRPMPATPEEVRERLRRTMRQVCAGVSHPGARKKDQVPAPASSGGWVIPAQRAQTLDTAGAVTMPQC